MPARVLSERLGELCEDEGQKTVSYNSSQSLSQGSVNNKDTYNSELHRDGQDPFA